MLLWNFIDELSIKVGRQIERISNKSMEDVFRYSWPGNVRELRNIVEYSIIMCQGNTLDIQVPERKELDKLNESMDENQRMHIINILNQVGWRIRGIGGAAEILGMKESTLRYRMKKLGINRK